MRTTACRRALRGRRGRSSVFAIKVNSGDSWSDYDPEFVLQLRYVAYRENVFHADRRYVVVDPRAPRGSPPTEPSYPFGAACHLGCHNQAQSPFPRVHSSLTARSLSQPRLGGLDRVARRYGRRLHVGRLLLGAADADADADEDEVPPTAAPTAMPAIAPTVGPPRPPPRGSGPGWAEPVPTTPVATASTVTDLAGVENISAAFVLSAIAVFIVSAPRRPPTPTGSRRRS